MVSWDRSQPRMLERMTDRNMNMPVFVMACASANAPCDGSDGKAVKEATEVREERATNVVTTGPHLVRERRGVNLAHAQPGHDQKAWNKAGA